MRWKPPFARSYAVLLATMVLARVALAAMGAAPIIASQGVALAWSTLLVLALLGWGALFLAARVGFAAEWEQHGPVWRWYALAVLVAVVYGLLSASGDIGVWAKQNGDAAVREAFGTVDVHQRFPASIPFYYYGGAFLEIFLRLLALTGLTWLLRPLLGRSRPMVAFWTSNAVVSLYEPWPYLTIDLGNAPAAAWPSVISDHLLGELYLANFFTGYLYRRSGLWTAVIFRFSYYLVWHVTYGGFRPFWLELLLR